MNSILTLSMMMLVILVSTQASSMSQNPNFRLDPSFKSQGSDFTLDKVESNLSEDFQDDKSSNMASQRKRKFYGWGTIAAGSTIAAAGFFALIRIPDLTITNSTIGKGNISPISLQTPEGYDKVHKIFKQENEFVNKGEKIAMVSQTISPTASTVQNADAYKRNLQNQIETSKSRISGKKAELKSLEKELSRISTNNPVVMEKNIKKANVAIYERDLESLIAQRDTVVSVNEENQRNLTTKFEILYRDGILSESELVDREESQLYAQRELMKINREIELLRQRISFAKNENVVLEATHASAVRGLSERNAQISTLKRDIATVEGEITEANSKIQYLKEQIKQGDLLFSHSNEADQEVVDTVYANASGFIDWKAVEGEPITDNLIATIQPKKDLYYEFVIPTEQVADYMWYLENEKPVEMRFIGINQGAIPGKVAYVGARKERDENAEFQTASLPNRFSKHTNQQSVVIVIPDQDALDELNENTNIELQQPGLNLSISIQKQWINSIFNK